MQGSRISLLAASMLLLAVRDSSEMKDITLESPCTEYDTHKLPTLAVSTLCVTRCYCLINSKHPYRHTHTHEQWKQTKLTDKWNTTKPNLTQMERRRSQTRDASMQQVLAGQQRHILRAVSGPIIHRNRLTGVTQTSISSSMQIILSIMQSCVLNQSILDSQSTNSDYLLPLHHNIKQHKSYQAVCLKHHKTTYREKNIS